MRSTHLLVKIRMLFAQTMLKSSKKLQNTVFVMRIETIFMEKTTPPEKNFYYSSQLLLAKTIAFLVYFLTKNILILVKHTHRHTIILLQTRGFHPSWKKEGHSEWLIMEKYGL